MFDYWQGWHIALMLLMTAISIVLIIICLKIKRRQDQEVIIVRNVQSMYQPPMYSAMNPQAAYQHPNAMRSQQAFVPSQPYPVYVQQVIPQYQHLIRRKLIFRKNNKCLHLNRIKPPSSNRRK